MLNLVVHEGMTGFGLIRIANVDSKGEATIARIRGCEHVYVPTAQPCFVHTD